MILRLPGSEHAEIIDFSGLYEDGWCEPVLRCTLRVLKDSTRCQLGVWLKPELERVTGNFSVSVNGRHSFQCRVPHDVSTIVQVACPASAGDTVVLDISCDNLVVDKGSDLRPLSFLLTSLGLS